MSIHIFEIVLAEKGTMHHRYMISSTISGQSPSIKPNNNAKSLTPDMATYEKTLAIFQPPDIIAPPLYNIPFVNLQLGYSITTFYLRLICHPLFSF